MRGTTLLFMSGALFVSGGIAEAITAPLAALSTGSGDLAITLMSWAPGAAWILSAFFAMILVGGLFLGAVESAQGPAGS